MIRVCLVDDQTLVRQGIRSLLALDDGIEVVAEAADGAEAIGVLEAGEPAVDVVLMDLQMGEGMDGVSATRAVRERRPDVQVLILTTFDTEADILAALDAGATVVNPLEDQFWGDRYGVVRDPFGRLFIVTDSPALQWSQTTPTVDTGFYSLGLQQGAILVGQNNDFDYTTTDQTGYENIRRTYQAEWSYNVGVKGFAWDKANGGPSPTNAALFASPNWDRYSTSHKDLAGVVLKTK